METRLNNRGFCAIALLLAIPTAEAQEAGQLVLNAGWFHVAPQTASQPMTAQALGTTTTLVGSGASADNSDTVGLTASYFVTNHVAVETTLAIPPKLTLYGTGTLAALGNLGSARTWSPTIQVEYHFGETTSRLRPYLGAGISYVWFSDIRLSNGISTGQFLHSPKMGNQLEGPTSASFSKSFVPVVSGGLTYSIDSHWSLGAAISYSWLTTRATLTTTSALGTVTSQAKIKLNPIVTFLSVGYRF